MSKPQDGGPAFPTTKSNTIYGMTGLSKREYFAGQAMQAICTSTSNGWVASSDAVNIAERAVSIADALIAALEA